MAAPSFEDLFTLFRAELIDRRPDLTVDEGDISEMYAYGGAAMGDHVIGYFARLFKATFLDGASGQDLFDLGDDHWNVQQRLATNSVGSLRFNRATAGAGAGTIPAGTVVATAKDAQGREVQVETDADVSYGAAETGDKGVAAHAILTGPEGNVAAGKLTKISSTLFDASITVTNPAVFAGGDVAESEDDYRERVRALPSAIRRATLAALEYGANLVTGVAKATALEDSTGIVTIYITDASGSYNQTLLDAVALEIENWRAAGVLVNIAGGAIYNLTGINITLQVRAGVDTQAVASKVKTAITEAINKLKIGEPKLGAAGRDFSIRDLIKNAAKNVDPDGILGVVVNSPSADVYVTDGQLMRTTVGDITIA